VGEVVRYTYRLRPGARAERALMAEWHRCRWLWNEAVHQQKSGRRSARPSGNLLSVACGRAGRWCWSRPLTPRWPARSVARNKRASGWPNGPSSAWTAGTPLTGTATLRG